MNNTINEAYINALLADASYVDLRTNVNANLTKRLTQPLADFVVANFEVLNQEPDSLLDGFSATVWYGKAGTDYAGQTYVSMRGTAGARDIADDVQLALTGITYNQIASMVNWWLRETTAEGVESDWRLAA